MFGTGYLMQVRWMLIYWNNVQKELQMNIRRETTCADYPDCHVNRSRISLYQFSKNSIITFVVTVGEF